MCLVVTFIYNIERESDTYYEIVVEKHSVEMLLRSCGDVKLCLMGNMSTSLIGIQFLTNYNDFVISSVVSITKNHMRPGIYTDVT